MSPEAGPVRYVTELSRPVETFCVYTDFGAVPGRFYATCLKRFASAGYTLAPETL